MKNLKKQTLEINTCSNVDIMLFLHTADKKHITQTFQQTKVIVNL